MAAGQFVQGGIQFTRLEGFTGFDLLPALPPVGAGVIEYILRLWFGLSLRGAFLGLILEL
jgi:hypothetical protein